MSRMVSFGPWRGACRVFLGATMAACFVLALQARPQVFDQKLVPMDGSPGDEFGQTTALIPGWAFVGSPYDDDVEFQSGAVYVYESVGSGWLFRQKLKAIDPAFGATLGDSLAASGDWLVASTSHDDPQGVFSAGSAHVYNNQGGTWAHHQKLVASDFDSGYAEYFGLGGAAIDGGVMVIGEKFDDYKHIDSGSAYVFELQGSTWVETAKLFEQDWEFQGHFGSAADVDGDTLVIGAETHSNGIPFSFRGAAYVFERIGGAWVQTQKLLPNDPATQDYFGGSVAIDGDTILVGSLSHQHTPGPNLQGAAYVFTKQGASWVQTQELAPTDPWIPLLFGRDVDLEGGLAVVGANGDSDLGGGSGSAYAFKRVGGSWVQVGKMLAPDGKLGDVLGYSLCMSGTKVLAGAHGSDEACQDCNSGSAYLFDLAPDVVQYCHCPQIGPCGNHDDFGGCANSSGQGAVLSAAGSTSVALDALTLEARWLRPNVLGILFMGGAQNLQPFGDGRLCLGSGAAGVYRLLPPKASGAAGVMTWDGGIVATTQSNPSAGQIAPGQTWHFQTWYRDPLGPCGSSFNLSNGLRVVFTP